MFCVLSHIGEQRIDGCLIHRGGLEEDRRLHQFPRRTIIESKIEQRVGHRIGIEFEVGRVGVIGGRQLPDELGLQRQGQDAFPVQPCVLGPCDGVELTAGTDEQLSALLDVAAESSDQVFTRCLHATDHDESRAG